MTNSSVHLQQFPEKYSNINYSLIEQMNFIKDICSNILSIRKDNNIKVRIPLSMVTVYGKNIDFIDSYRDVILSEVNVKDIVLSDKIDEIGEHSLKIDFKKLGPKVGNKIKLIMQDLNVKKYDVLPNQNIMIAGIEIDKQDFKMDFIMKDEKNGRFSKNSNLGVILDTKINESLVQEGIARDFVRIIQQERKLLDLNINARINLVYFCEDKDVQKSITEHKEYIKAQCLIKEIHHNNEKDCKSFPITDSEVKIKVYV